MSRRRIGRVRVDFSVIERAAAEELQESPLSKLAASWELSRKSALHRRKDGTYTLCLIWRGDDGTTLTKTIRGLRGERS